MPGRSVLVGGRRARAIKLRRLVRLIDQGRDRVGPIPIRGLRRVKRTSIPVNEQRRLLLQRLRRGPLTGCVRPTVVANGKLRFPGCMRGVMVLRGVVPRVQVHTQTVRGGHTRPLVFPNY